MYYGLEQAPKHMRKYLRSLSSMLHLLKVPKLLFYFIDKQYINDYANEHYAFQKRLDEIERVSFNLIKVWI